MASLSCEATTYLQVLLSVYSRLLSYQSPADLSSLTTLTSGDTYDFVIVGGGAAGCVLASR